VDGQYTIRSRSTDLATNVQTPLASITVTVDNTLPMVTFDIPVSYHPSVLPANMPISTFSVNESNPDVYCLTTTNSSAGCVWSATKPTTITVTSEGSKTIYAWARDKSGNVSAVKSDTVLVALLHTLNIDLAGNGGGSVLFQQRSATYNIDTQVTVYSYDPVTLQATPAEFSLFGGWSGICTGASCAFTVPTVLAGGATQTAAATFTYDSGHAVFVAPNYFDTILGAYGAGTTINGDDIRIFGTSFNENLLFDKEKDITLTGGDHHNHTPDNNGMTTVQGMTILSGTVTIDKITIR
jgi:hypothetical protein